MKNLGLFKQYEHLLQCPLCQASGKMQGQSFICANRHCFDLAAKGYLNFAQSARRGIYSKALFESRQSIFGAGFYAPLAAQIIESIKEIAPETIVDVGCGEGYYERQLRKNASIPGSAAIIGIDIERDAILQACRHPDAIAYLIGDSNALPLAPSSMDCVLNILAPANYEEFRRVLSRGGVVIKVVPNEDYLVQIRDQIRPYLKSDAYSNKEVVDLFSQNLSLISKQDIRYTLPVTGGQAMDFFQMTPMAGNIDAALFDPGKCKEITIDLKIMIGKAPK